MLYELSLRRQNATPARQELIPVNLRRPIFSCIRHGIGSVPQTRYRPSRSWWQSQPATVKRLITKLWYPTKSNCWLRLYSQRWQHCCRCGICRLASRYVDQVQFEVSNKFDTAKFLQLMQSIGVLAMPPGFFAAQHFVNSWGIVSSATIGLVCFDKIITDGTSLMWSITTGNKESAHFETEIVESDWQSPMIHTAKWAGGGSIPQMGSVLSQKIECQQTIPSLRHRQRRTANSIRSAMRIQVKAGFSQGTWSKWPPPDAEGRGASHPLTQEIGDNQHRNR